MVAAGDENMTVTSWGWMNEDGYLCHKADAEFRLWRVRTGEGIVGLMALPTTDAVEALDVAWKAFN